MKYSIKAELHCHSLRRNRLFYCPLLYDSVQTEEEIISKCIEKDIKILCISDHDSLEGYRIAKNIIKEKNLNLILIAGMEISSKDGHILAYNIKKEIPPNLSARKTVELIHSQNGVAVAAHPYMILGLGDKIFQVEFDAIEVFNSTIPNWANNKCVRKTKDSKIPLTAGSDAHQPENVGTSHLLFPIDTKTADDVMKYLREGKFKTLQEKTPGLDMVITHFKKNFSIQFNEFKNYINL